MGRLQKQPPRKRSITHFFCRRANKCIKMPPFFS
nr:MAG TPA: hypothetical protein [Caudoviricetes sp.]